MCSSTLAVLTVLALFGQIRSISHKFESSFPKLSHYDSLPVPPECPVSPIANDLKQNGFQREMCGSDVDGRHIYEWPTVTYTINIVTDSHYWSGTDSHASIKLLHEDHEQQQFFKTPMLPLFTMNEYDSTRSLTFNKEGNDTFVWNNVPWIESIDRIELYCVPMGDSPGWFPDSITIHDSLTGIKYIVKPNAWICEDEDDSKMKNVYNISYIVPADSKTSMVPGTQFREKRAVQPACLTLFYMNDVTNVSSYTATDVGCLNIRDFVPSNIVCAVNENYIAFICVDRLANGTCTESGETMAQSMQFKKCYGNKEDCWCTHKMMRAIVRSSGSHFVFDLLEQNPNMPRRSMLVELTKGTITTHECMKIYAMDSANSEQVSASVKCSETTRFKSPSIFTNVFDFGLRELHVHCVEGELVTVRLFGIGQKSHETELLFSKRVLCIEKLQGTKLEHAVQQDEKISGSWSFKYTVELANSE
jgi:hypothetical protein